MEYDVVIGLETHAELDTDTKLFVDAVRHLVQNLTHKHALYA